MRSTATLRAVALVFWSATEVTAEDFPLSKFPLYAQANSWVRSCVNSISPIYSTSFGCSQNPASCLCTDASKSSRVAQAIRNCVGIDSINIAASYSHITTAASLWASYCLTNAGVSARDETYIQDIPLYTRVDSWVRSCAFEQYWTDVETFGCGDYTKAPCLCQSASSVKHMSLLRNRIFGAGTSLDREESASQLWSSYCNVNLATPAVRRFVPPPSVSGKIMEVDDQTLSLLTYNH